MKLKVLVIEHAADVLHLIRYICKRCDLEVVGAISAEEGVYLAKHFQPMLIICDHSQALDSLTVLDVLGRDPVTARIPIIILTTDDTPSLHQRVQRAGAVHSLEKPFKPTDLRRSIEAMLKPLARTGS